MRTLEEHRDAILAAVTPRPPVRTPLADCLGLVLCEDVTSLVDLPGFDNSAMDGYAVRAADVAAADPTAAGTAVRLPVVAEVAAGGVATRAVAPGEAVRIMTGAMMPAGADAIVKVEDTDGGTDTVEIRAGVPVGTSVRPAGEDVTQGQVVLSAGATIDARRVALLAATGHADALVRPRPRVAIVSTGAELVAPGNPLQPGQIHESNSYMLAAAVMACGAEAVRQPTVDDDPAAVLSAVAALAADVDAIVTSGGVSMGAYDVVKESLRGHGVDFVQVAMQPGKPQGFGLVGARNVPLFALPGNPVSSYVSFEVFVRPALRRMMGRSPENRTAVPARLEHALSSPPGRTQVARAVASHTVTGWRADPVWGQASHFVADLARANALVFVPADVTRIEAGDQVDVWLLDDRILGQDDAMSDGRQGGGLTHVRADGSAHMVDVSGKDVTAREATAAGRVLLSPAAVAALRSGAVPKGDALAVARIAGIQAAKRTPELVPLAHPVAVHAVAVDLSVADDGVDIAATVRTADRTGIEMEALTAVCVGALALVDMVKAVDKHARITDVRVTAKSGGRSGDWSEP